MLRFRYVRLVLTLFLLGLGIHVSSAPKKVACIGNSITEGVGLPSSDSYPMIMQTLFDAAEYEVKNFGVSGRTLIKKGDWPYWNEAKYAQSLAWEPDIVIIKLGTNDVNPRGNWNHINDYVKDYLEFIDSYKKLKSNPKIYICYPAPAFSGNFMGIDDQSIIVEQLMPKIDSVATLTGLEIIDLHTPLLDKERFFYDKIHPNFKGTTYMAHIVAKAICSTCDIEPIAENFLVDIATKDYTDTATKITSSLDLDFSLLNDNKAATGVLIPSSEVELKMEFLNPFKISAYSFTSGKGDKKCFPKSWKIEGSRTGKLWYPIDERKNQIFEELETQIYKLASIHQVYAYYRIKITENGGGESLAINEFQLFGVPEKSEADITTNGGVITGQYEGYPGELIGNVIDKNVQTKYCVVDKKGGWIQYDSPKAVKVGKYIITTTKDLAERDPKSWKFLGSNNGIDWNILDIRTNQNFAGPYHAMEFDVQIQDEYSKFRFEITEIKRSSTFELSELQIVESNNSSINEITLQTTVYSKDGVVYIETDGDEVKDYYIYDGRGNILMSGKVQNRVEIADVKSSGVYILNIVCNAKSSTTKVIL